MRCKVCGLGTDKLFVQTVLNKYKIQYYKCNNCKFVQTENEYWLNEAYANPINISDVGYLNRNNTYSEKITVLLYLLFSDKGKYMDFAAGYGVFVRLMRDIGFDYFWEDRYSLNLFAKGFEANLSDKFNAVTLFEVFEHFEDPIKEINNILNFTDYIIFSTETYSKELDKNWWYLGLDHGQHIAFYSSDTLKYVAKKFELNYYNLGSLHILSKHGISFWIFLLLKLQRFGLYYLIIKLMKSRTLSDYSKFVKNGAQL
jgi:hypothetical protein